MSESICEFIPLKRYNESINTINFVYETEFSRIKKPFLRSAYMLHIITSGTAVLRVGEQQYPLKRGSIFIAFPALPYEITDDEDFRYMYITFIGMRAVSVFEQLHIGKTRPVYDDMDPLIPFWESAIHMLTPSNANILTESVLLYTLSHMCKTPMAAEDAVIESETAAAIKKYVDSHYADYDLSLKKLAEKFSYNEKYLSSMFRQHIGTGFSAYLKDLRLQRACELMNEGMTILSEIAALSGFKDPLYFSKVFKQQFGKTPSEFIKGCH